MRACPLPPRHRKRQSERLRGWGLGLAGLAGVLLGPSSAASGSAQGLAVATVIVPASVMASLVNVTSFVQRSGGWIKLTIPTARQPQSTSADLGGTAHRRSSTADAAAGTASHNDPHNETLSGAFATSLSAPTTSSDGLHITVAFN